MSNDLTRRKVIKLGASSLAGAAVASNSAILAQTSPQAPAVIPSRPDARSYDFVIIGTGFGATIAATSLVEKAVAQNKAISILMLERGVWWVTPQNLGFPKP